MSASELTDYKKILEPGSHKVEVVVGAYTREFTVFTPHPDLISKGPQALVFFYHGAGGSASQAARVYGWKEKAESEHFFVVFPQGLPKQPGQPPSFSQNPCVWRDGRASLATPGVDDVAFFRAMLDWLLPGLPINPKAVYVTGFSNGGGMAFALGAHFSDRIAAIGPVAAENPTAHPPEYPLNVVYITGLEDPLNPFEGGTVKLPWGGTPTMPPVMQSIDQWIEWDGCTREGMLLGEQEGVRKTMYGPGNDSVQVLTYMVEGLGHHWPGTKEPLPKSIRGPIRDPFHATDLIWDFFVYHPKTELKEKY